MDNTDNQDDFICIAEYINFAKRRKVCIVISIIFFSITGFIFALSAPTTYTISAVIKPPSTEAFNITAAKINGNVYPGETGELIDKLEIRAKPIPAPELIRMESRNINEDAVEDSIESMKRLISGLVKHYEQEVQAEKAALSRIHESDKKLTRIIESIAESAEEPVALTIYVLHREILSMMHMFYNREIYDIEQLKSQTRNIEIAKGPNASKIAKPSMTTSLGIAGFTGLVIGLLIGFAKDIKSGKDV